MAEPLIDLTVPQERRPRATTARPRGKTSPAGRVQRSRSTQAADPPDPKAEKAQRYAAWLTENVDPWYLRGANLIAGADLRQISIPQPDGTAKSVAEMIAWAGGPKPFMAARAVAELEELPQIARVIAWFGPIAPWLMLGGLGVAVGMDVVSVIRLRPVLKEMAASQAQAARAVPDRQPAPETQQPAAA